MRTLAASVLSALVACAGTAAAAAPPAPLPGEGFFTVRWARLPPDDTWIAGLAFDHRGATSVSLYGDAVRLRDPRPDVEDHGGMVLAGAALGREVARSERASLHVEAVGTLFLAAVGDFGFGAPGVGPGLRADWRLSPKIALVGSARFTVPLPLLDAAAGLRVRAGRLALSAGWRDVRFLPVLGDPGRYASGAELAVATAF